MGLDIHVYDDSECPNAVIESRFSCGGSQTIQELFMKPFNNNSIMVSVQDLMVALINANMLDKYTPNRKLLIRFVTNCINILVNKPFDCSDDQVRTDTSDFETLRIILEI